MQKPIHPRCIPYHAISLWFRYAPKLDPGSDDWIVPAQHVRGGSPPSLILMNPILQWSAHPEEVDRIRSSNSVRPLCTLFREAGNVTPDMCEIRP